MDQTCQISQYIQQHLPSHRSFHQSSASSFIQLLESQCSIMAWIMAFLLLLVNTFFTTDQPSLDAEIYDICPVISDSLISFPELPVSPLPVAGDPSNEQRSMEIYVENATAHSTPTEYFHEDFEHFTLESPIPSLESSISSASSSPFQLEISVSQNHPPNISSNCAAFNTFQEAPTPTASRSPWIILIVAMSILLATYLWILKLTCDVGFPNFSRIPKTNIH